jgi:hypothetical protein
VAAVSAVRAASRSVVRLATRCRSREHWDRSLDAASSAACILVLKKQGGGVEEEQIVDHNVQEVWVGKENILKGRGCGGEGGKGVQLLWKGER